MADTGWLTAGNVTNDTTGVFGDGSEVAWSNPTNAEADDGSYATSAVPNTSQALYGDTFGASVPTGATINGIETLIQIHFGGGIMGASANHEYWRLSPDGSVGSSTAHDGGGGVTTSSESSITRGGASDLWAETLTSTICNSGAFGFMMSVTSGGMAGTTYIDVMQIKITYTESAGSSIVNIESTHRGVHRGVLRGAA